MKFKSKSFKDYKSKDFLYGRKGPWPQPSPEHPLGEAPAILHVPMREWIDWWWHIGSRFVTTLIRFPAAYLDGITNGSLDKIDDREFMELFENTMLSKFICSDLDKIDQEIFKDYLNPEDDFYILDFEIAKVVKPFPGIYVSGTKTLLRKRPEGKFKYEPLVIYIDSTKTHIEPSDGDRWELAKYYALQGAALGITLVVHSILHFPLDSINAITKTAVPKEHILFKLISPHLRFTLPLENAVLTFKTTVIRPSWWKVYSPHPGPAEGLRDLLVEGFKGIEGNASYNSYQYPMRPIKIHANFGEYRDRYYQVFLDFVSKVLEDFDRKDKIIMQWAKHIAHHVPGFPDESSIMKGNNLAEAVAYYMWAVSVGHAVDHETYATIGVRKKPMRLRQPPPGKNEITLNRAKLNKFWDLGKYTMAQTLFFKAWTVDYLLEINYNFCKKSQTEAANRFFRDLQELDLALKDEGICYMDIKNMPSSIQY